MKEKHKKIKIKINQSSNCR